MRPEVSPDLLTAALKNSMSLQTVFDSLFDYEEAFVRVMAEGLEDACRGARRGAPFLDRIARRVPFPTPLGMLNEKTYDEIRAGWPGAARALAPPAPTDPAFISWDAGFLWGIVTFVKHSVGSPSLGFGVPDVLQGIEFLRSLPNLWGEIGRFLSYLPLRVRVAYTCGTQPDTPFDAGKTVGIGVAWIVTIWFILRQALQLAREFGTVLRECGGLTRLARDPAGFADDAGRLFGPGHKPATPEQRARIKDGVDRVGQPVGPRVYRVQGGAGPPRISHERVRLDPDGRITIVPEAGKSRQTMLHVTIDDPTRARVYLRENRPGGHVVSFEVDPDFAIKVRSAAVRQEKASASPGRPQIDDPRRTTHEVRARLGLAAHESSAYGLPPEWIARLERAAVPGTARQER